MRVERLSGAVAPDVAVAVAQLLAAEEADTGRRPLDEARRLELAAAAADAGDAPPADRTHWLRRDDAGRLVGYAVRAGDTAEIAATDAAAAAELLAVVGADPRARWLWTHGDRARARIAADAAGLARDRELVVLARRLPAASPQRPLPPGVTVRAFDPARDTDAWLALNAAAFADLPDQASWTAGDLNLRLHAPWFDPADFLVAVAPDGTLAGFHWTKVDPAAGAVDGSGVSGEVFVIAVADSWRGTGLAAALLDLGLAHLAARGLSQVHLFVDAANARAIALYERAGFRRADGDRRFAL